MAPNHQPLAPEEITGIARKIIYNVEREESGITWLELELTRLYCAGIMLGREQGKEIAISTLTGGPDGPGKDG
jgi:hypothetical protein